MWPETKCAECKEQESGFRVIYWWNGLGMKGGRKKEDMSWQNLGCDGARFLQISMMSLTARDDLEVIETHKVL